MNALIFILVFFILGLTIERKIKFSSNLWSVISFSFVIGLFISTWLTFLSSFLTGFNLWAIYLSVFFQAIVIYKLGKALSWKEQIKVIYSDVSVSLLDIILLIAIVPFYVFCLWTTDNGDTFILGNYNDIAFHMSFVTAFTEQEEFIPDYPQVAGAKMCYHFMINFSSAILHKAGLSLMQSVNVIQILLSVFLSFLLSRFFKCFAHREFKISFFAVVLFIFGNIAFFNLITALCKFPLGGRIHSLNNVFSEDFILNVVLFPFFNFLSIIINYLHPQRPFLFGLPFACIIYLMLLKFLAGEGSKKSLLLLTSLLIGFLPLFHLHTFLILALTLVMFLYTSIKDKTLSIKCYLLLLPSLPQLFFLLSAKTASNFSGFDVSSMPALSDVRFLNSAILSRLIFWIRVSGFPFILGYMGVFWFLCCRWNQKSDMKNYEWKMNLLFFIPTFFWFVVINFYRMMPNWGDSNKFFLYHDMFLAFLQVLFY